MGRELRASHGCRVFVVKRDLKDGAEERNPHANRKASGNGRHRPECSLLRPPTINRQVREDRLRSGTSFPLQGGRAVGQISVEAAADDTGQRNIVGRSFGRPTVPARSSQRTGECVRHGRAARVLQSLLHALEAHGRHHTTCAGSNLCLHGPGSLRVARPRYAAQQIDRGSLHGIGRLPRNDGTKHWPLVASAAMAEVMRGLWGDATNVAAQNIADIDSLEQQIAKSFDLPGRWRADRSIMATRSAPRSTRPRATTARIGAT